MWRMGEELHSLLQPRQRHLPPIRAKRTSEGIPDRTLASQNPLSRELSWFVCFLYSLRNSWPTRTETPSSVTCWVPPLWRGTSASILRTGATPLPCGWSSGDAEQVWSTHAFPQSTKPAQCYSISRLLLAFYDISIWGRGFGTSSSLSWSFTMTVSSYPVSASSPTSRPRKSSSSAPLTAGPPASSQPASTSATLPPRMTSSQAAVAASSSGTRNLAAPATNTETSSLQQKEASFIDTTSSDVKMQSTESSSMDGESSEAPETKTTNFHSSPGPRPALVTKVSSLTPTAISPAASPLRDYHQGLASFSATPPVALSISQAKFSDDKSVLSAVRTRSLVPAGTTTSGPPASTRLLPSATSSQTSVSRNVVPTFSFVEEKV